MTETETEQTGEVRLAHSAFDSTHGKFSAHCAIFRSAATAAAAGFAAPRLRPALFGRAALLGPVHAIDRRCRQGERTAKWL